jgi:mannitol-specific phosphotransferase system IIBC component
MGEAVCCVVVVGCDCGLVDGPFSPESVFRDFLPFKFGNWAASAGVGSVVGLVVLMVLSTTMGFTMMNLCSHARKDELADARRLMADLTETSSTLSTQGQIG